jgi:hypothetical protein
LCSPHCGEIVATAFYEYSSDVIESRRRLDHLWGIALAFVGACPNPERKMQVAFTRTEPPRWLIDMWKEIDDKTFGHGFDCFTEDAVCNLGVADWKGREAIRSNLKAFIDTGFTALHHVTEYWDGGNLKVFRGVVDMTPDDRSGPTVHPTMTHFFYMDEKDNTKVRRWVGAVGPVAFG